MYSIPKVKEHHIIEGVPEIPFGSTDPDSKMSTAGVSALKLA